MEIVEGAQDRAVAQVAAELRGAGEHIRARQLTETGRAERTGHGLHLAWNRSVVVRLGRVVGADRHEAEGIAGVRKV